MRAAAFRDVLKVLFYLVSCFVLAAIITPPFYEMGKGFANQTLSQDSHEALKWLATKAERAQFDTYYKRALLLVAVLGLYPLSRSLRSRFNPGRLRGTEWEEHLDPTTFAHNRHDLRSARSCIFQIVPGFLLSTTIVFLLAWGLLHFQWFEWKGEPTTDKLVSVAGRALRIAIFVSIVEELLFRGALLSIFLRAFKPAVAIVFLSFLFASSHFLSPPDDIVIEDPAAPLAGMELLYQTGLRFIQPSTIMRGFLPLFLIGIVLGIARYRTRSLWLPIGLHIGWIFAEKVVGRMTRRIEDFDPSLNIYVGKKLTNGLIPSAGIIVTGLILLAILRFLEPRKRT